MGLWFKPKVTASERADTQQCSQRLGWGKREPERLQRPY
jgi:hypothetical protein